MGERGIRGRFYNSGPGVLFNPVLIVIPRFSQPAFSTAVRCPWIANFDSVKLWLLTRRPVPLIPRSTLQGCHSPLLVVSIPAFRTGSVQYEACVCMWTMAKTRPRFRNLKYPVQKKCRVYLPNPRTLLRHRRGKSLEFAPSAEAKATESAPPNWIFAK